MGRVGMVDSKSHERVMGVASLLGRLALRARQRGDNREARTAGGMNISFTVECTKRAGVDFGGVAGEREGGFLGCVVRRRFEAKCNGEISSRLG